MTLVQDLRSALPDVAVRDGLEVATGLRGGAEPELVVSPSSTSEVVEVCAWAGRQGLGVLPVGRGAHVDLVRDGRFIVLETSRLTGIEEYEAADMTITARAGTSFGVVDDALAEHGQWAPFDPPSVRTRSIGGFISAAAHGPLWAGYGALKNHVLGATLVTGDGRILRLGGKVVKNVAGYDLLRPVVGGRGRLGIVTSVCLRAFPKPHHERVLVLSDRSVPELLDAGVALGTAPILPVSIVVSGPLKELDGRSALVVRLHGAESTVDADQATLESHIRAPLDRVHEADSLLDEIRDRGGVESRRVEVSVLPSRLRDVVSAMRNVGFASSVVDSYAGRIRIGSNSLEREAVDALRGAAEGAGGALRVVRWAGDDRPAGTPQREAEAGLSERLESIFDPDGVLWPARP